MFRCVFILCLALNAGCATPRQSRLTAAGVGFTTGLIGGTAMAPKDEKKELHAMYWGSLLGLAALVVGEFYFSEERELEFARLETARLKAELELVQNGKTILLKEGQGRFKEKSGEDIFPSGKARWRLYQTDRWVKDGPTRLLHQDRMLELLPVEESSTR